MIALKTQDLTIGYRSKINQQVVAQSINISCNKGELVGVIGGNGVGKSTLLRTLTNIQPPLQGKVFLFNKNIIEYSPLELSKTLSLVLTEQSISKNLSVFELIALGRNPYTNWLGKLSLKDLSVINTVISQTELTSIQHKKCYELSDGQLQNVLVARALAQDTPLIVLDEPTTHLDIYHKVQILMRLKTIANSGEKTILFSTHEIELAIQLCDKIMVMKKDMLIIDTPINLVNEGVFNRLFPKEIVLFDKASQTFKVVHKKIET